MAIINPIYFLALTISLLMSLALAPLMIKISFHFRILDQPASADRKIHKKDVALLGGWAVFLSVFVPLIIFRWYNLADFSKISDQFIAVVFLAGLLIMIGGTLDDKYRLLPWQQIIWPLLASGLTVLAGIRISYITNPLGTSENAIIYLAPVLGGALSFIWLMAIIYTTKLLDGLDGLVAGITAIAAIMIFALSLDWDLYLSATGIWALLLLGASSGFLFFNWHPAKIFLGESGSLFMGFMLGVLSIISGSKIATTLLVVGIPALDVLLVMASRIIKRESPFSHADKKHLHFRLLMAGFKHREAVLFLYLLAIIFGLVAVVSGSLGKLIGLIALIALMSVIILVVYKKSSQDVSKT
ncbi:MAG: hypothetical protein A3B89_01270 [Candidatus Buchananbacteria bacterium RIFCSPHIGHO2_02_FULL_40_13]|uniref:Undecaprenyl-phosphate alpha-N-acetylglucosaminyl 1-phosphate transferase n=1 Tax=Candidatus Buchananbacteria bacterium RIFCSPLOWO2_01_FULL_39_33 TaxID=1797543 RepID=A0A1G1YL88_9BACT|nr:MAG: hypothetical protein A2820_03425 [Candidatus Buchananbacteria bacterium RIFCSPHIGHO2_01_FULL_40_35]OGY50120.1 MAG: hypothetical protein A3B89_01270 [Candidatus Buchananbacteria bacterium RIFCSPHIGHO2_02_FULL_40_13]OGY53102.1 MAG: hypothetical protein A3A02_00085 [Candidatus Buchananbacteria bacterium RIFCSPLOWO2_01_FULL_39_33]